MESNDSIFNLSIDPLTKNHLSDAARWARTLAIIGLVSLALLLIAGAYLAVVLPEKLQETNSPYSRADRDITTATSVGMAIGYLVVAVIWFFPLMYLLRFSNQMRSAIAANNQENLNTSFQNLKICFRYLAIMTIIIIALYILGMAGRMASI